MENYIAGLFVKEPMQANGIGSQLIAVCKESEGKADLGGISEKYASGSVLP